jgi:hypothetical protein
MMKVDFQIQGLDEITGRFAKHPARIEKATESQLRMQARSLCKDLSYYTGPEGFGERSRRQIARFIEADLRKMFPANELSTSNANQIYKLVNQQFGEEVADAFWFHFKAQDYQKAGRYMRRRGIPRGVNESEYDRRRKRPGGVGGDPIALASKSRVESLIRRRQKRIGMAKSGWYQAARGVGGRLRTTNSAGVTRATYPKWVIAAGRGLQLGGARFKGGRQMQMLIYSRVRHGRAALRAGVMTKALAATQVRLKKVLEKAIEAENKKYFKR